MLDIQPYVLRYWQTEFRALAPRKGGGDADFSDGDLETIRRIKELLYDEGYTIASAKKKLAAELEDGRLRGRPPMPVPEDEPEGEQPPAEAEAEAKEVEETEDAAPVEEAEEAEAEEAEETPSPGAGDLGALTRRVERLERGVAELVAQTRQLAAELGPEATAEGD